MNYKGLQSKPKKALHIFYVLDTSGSMDGSPIGALNDGMRNTVEELRKIDGDDVDLKIAVMEFNNNNRWVTEGTNGIEDLKDFIWTDLRADGLTRLGGALLELNKSMSRYDKMESKTGHKTPVVIFMSDGEPNDDWESALKELAQNGWYQHAIKIAFAVGEHADANVLAKVVGVLPGGTIVPTPEAVLKTTDLQAFADMIQVMSVNSVMISSKPKQLTGEKTGGNIVKEAIKNKEAEENSSINELVNDTEIFSDQEPDLLFDDFEFGDLRDIGPDDII